MTDAIEKAIKTIEHYAYLHWMKEGMGSGSGRTYALIPDSFKDAGEDAIQLLREYQANTVNQTGAEADYSTVDRLIDMYLGKEDEFTLDRGNIQYFANKVVQSLIAPNPQPVSAAFEELSRLLSPLGSLKMSASYSDLGLWLWNNRHAVTQALTQSGGQWLPIESAPDGKKVLIITKVCMSDSYFEPETAYRNGDYWFTAPLERLFGKPAFWMPLPSPPVSAKEE
jgi:hypothetical protein